MSGKLDGRTAVITGASRGIGALTAAALVKNGVRVVSLSRTAPPESAKITHVACDVTQPSSVTAAAKKVGQALDGAPDILINNAGIFKVGGLDQMPVETFNEILGTNLLGPFFVLNAFLSGMKQRGSGHVVTIGSVADRAAFKDNGAYSAAKYGLRGMQEVLRAELRGTGVRSTLVSPSAVDTGIWDPLSDASGNPSGFPPRNAMLRGEDVVAAIMFALTLPERANVDELRLSRS